MKKINLLTLCCLLILGMKSQNYDITGIKKIHPLSLRPLIEQDEVKGYYAFYAIDKASKKQVVYNLAILDNNLKQTYSVEMTKSDKVILLESAYNGAGFCLAFIDLREKMIEYVLLDKTGKTVGTKSIKVSKSEAQMYQMALTAEESYYSGGMLSVKNKGFLRVGYESESGLRIQLDLIDNSGKIKWTADSGEPESEKSFESASGLYADDKTIIAAISTRGKKLSAKGMETDLVFLNTDSGKELFKIKQNGAKNQLQFFGADYNENSSTFFVYGQYFATGDNLLKDDSKGLFIQEVGLDGKIKNESYTPWAGDINRIIVKKMKDKMKDNMKIFIHKVVRTSDGKMFAIGEQYRKAASALGIASMALSGGKSGVAAVKIEMYNILAFEFDNNFKIKDVHVVEKEKSNVSLPQGMGMMDANVLGFAMATWGYFDYCFTTTTSDKKQFNCAYINFDRDKEAGSDYTIGSVACNKEQKIVFDKMKLTSDPTFFRVLPCKPGYIAIYEYFKKKKKAVLRLEKQNI